jgi:LuxR family transcriptional regulator, maltose regulon positive regulatory protein
MQTSILQRVSGGLANAVCGRTHGWRILEELSRRNALIVPLDSKSEWYRYHHLFRDFLYERLSRLSGVELPQLHRAAALWFLEHQFLSEALLHAELSADAQLVQEIVDRCGGWLLVLRKGETVFRYFTKALPAAMPQYPRFALGRVYYLAQTGQLLSARRDFETLRKSTDGFHVPGLHGWDGSFFAECKLVDSILCVFEDNPLSPGEVEGLQLALADLPDVDPVVEGLVVNRLSIAYYDAGDFVRCRVFGEHAISRCKSGGIVYPEIYAHIYLGMALVAGGRFGEAEITYQRARDLASQSFGMESNLVALAKVLLAQVSLERNDLGAAKLLLDGNLEKVIEPGAWFEVYAAGYLTAAALAHIESGWENAVAVLDLARRTASLRKLNQLSALATVEMANLLIQADQLSEATALAESPVIVDAAARMSKTKLSLLDQELMLMRSRLYLRSGRFSEASRCAQYLRLGQDTGLRLVQHLRGLLLESLAHTRGGSPCAGDESMRIAVSKAAEEGLFRVFLDVGAELVPIASRLLNRSNQLRGCERRFLQDLLRMQEKDKAKEVQMENAAPKLSARESSVLLGLADGRSSKEIARVLGIAESTVKTYRFKLYRKLGAGTRSAVIAAARKWRLV